MCSPDRPPAPDVYVACNSSVHGWGGGLASARGLAQGLRQAGLEVCLLGVSDDCGSSAWAADGEALEVPSGVPRRLWRFRNTVLPYTLARQLRRLPRPRVAFVTVSTPWVCAARRAWPDVPVVLKFACLLRNCMPFVWGRARPGAWYAWLDYLGLCRVERAALRRAHLVLSPTRQSVAEIAAVAPRARVVTARYGVQPSAIPARARDSVRAACGVLPKDFVAALLGVCDRNKGFDLAVRALPHTDAGVRLLIVGDGPELPRLKALAAELGVAERVYFAGLQRETAPWYAAADCVLSTSRYDTFPNAIQEGLAAGRPVLVPTHNPPHVYSGMAEVVRNEGGGLCYARDVRALAAALARLATSPGLTAHLAENARRVALARAGWDDCVRQILALTGWNGAPAECGAQPVAGGVSSRASARRSSSSASVR